jgi:predicted nucleotidyltransferase
MPSASITLIRFSDSPKERLVYISFSFANPLTASSLDPRLGIAICSAAIYDKFSDLMNNIVLGNQGIRKMQKVDDYVSKTVPSRMRPLTERLISEIEEMASINVNIEHVGLFGSAARSFAQRSLDLDNRHVEHWRPESDIDLVMVIAETADREAVKSFVAGRLESQADKSLNEFVDLEWSNDKSTFYFFRKGFHVDVQLHHRNDAYYEKDTRLLGYSIFWGNYHVIYSQQNLPVDRFLRIPSEPIDEVDRIRLFLDDPLGLNEFIRRCKRADPRIDPRRVIATNLVNLVWALTGMRPGSVGEGIQYLKRKAGTGASGCYPCSAGLDEALLQRIASVLNQSTEAVEKNQEDLLKQCTQFLELLHAMLRTGIARG